MLWPFHRQPDPVRRLFSRECSCPGTRRLAEEKGSSYWKANALMWEGCVLALNGRAAEAIEDSLSWIAAYRSTAATIYIPFVSLHLARAYAELGQAGKLGSISTKP